MHSAPLNGELLGPAESIESDDVLEGLVDALVDDNLFGLSPPAHFPAPDFEAIASAPSQQPPTDTPMQTQPPAQTAIVAHPSQESMASDAGADADAEMTPVGEREPSTSSCSGRDSVPVPDVPQQFMGSEASPDARFLWDECPFLVLKDCSGAHIEPLSPVTGRGQLDVALQPPLLYWKERRRWMWHKKWCLPRVRVRLKQPIPSTTVPVGHALHVMISAGTIRDGHAGLADEGLVGTCQLPLEGGEVVFSSLLFKHTSFNCGNRPFHLVVTLLALVPDLAIPTSHKLIGVACYCSSPIHVDARKRTKGERPEASEDDVRLMQRQRGNAPFATATAGAPGSAAVAGVAEAGSPAAATMLALVQAMGCTVLELRADLLVLSVLSTSALGYRPQELVGSSLLNVLHPEEHSALVQTTQALMAMAAGAAGSAQIGATSAVRAVHRARMRNSDGHIESVVIDSTISAIGSGPGQPHQLLLSMRYATPPVGPDSAIFRVFPANAPMYFAT